VAVETDIDNVDAVMSRGDPGMLAQLALPSGHSVSSIQPGTVVAAPSTNAPLLLSHVKLPLEAAG
jgi:hypothetical protein